MTETPQDLEGYSHDDLLSVLARSDTARLKDFAETLIAGLGDIEVLENRSGLVMLPMRDTAQGTNFHLGEVLVSEARIRAGDQEGYGMCRGRDLEAAVAMALVDVSVARGLSHAECRAFVDSEKQAQAAQDRDVLRAVEATRVNMETF